MALTEKQALSKLRGAARRVIRAVKDFERAPLGLLDLCAGGNLMVAREDIDQAADALQAIHGKALRRAYRHAKRNGTGGTIVSLRRA